MERVEILWSAELRGREAFIQRTGMWTLVILPGWLRDTAHGRRLCEIALSSLAWLDVAV